MSVRPSRRRTFMKANWVAGGINKCFYCQKEVDRKERSIDHLTPEARGGTDTLANLVLCCRACNNAKADMTLAEFVEFVANNGGIERTKEIFGKDPRTRKHLMARER